jgi:hypothetical protein
MGMIYSTCTVMTTEHLNGQWHHVAGVAGPEGMKLYFDGVERCSNTRTDPVVHTRTNLWVGRNGSGSLDDFDGNIDDVRIYLRPLSASEIMHLAAGGS